MTQSLKVLIVEDEPLIAMMLEDFLDAIDHQVAGSVDCVPDALSRIEEGGFDLAILDVNLGGEPCWPVADRLVEQGKPFILASGGYLNEPPERHAGAPTVERPYTLDAVRSAFDRAMSRR